VGHKHITAKLTWKNVRASGGGGKTRETMPGKDPQRGHGNGHLTGEKQKEGDQAVPGLVCFRPNQKGIMQNSWKPRDGESEAAAQHRHGEWTDSTLEVEDRKGW